MLIKTCQTIKTRSKHKKVLELNMKSFAKNI